MGVCVRLGWGLEVERYGRCRRRGRREGKSDGV